MRVIADLCLVPMGVGVSVSRYVAACQDVFEKAGLETRLHAYGTNIEGEWDDVMQVLKDCHRLLHEMGAPRLHTTLRITTRTDRDQSIQEKIDSVHQRL